MSGLDTPAGCINELSRINRELAEMGPDWWTACGELARKEKEWERRFRVAMRHVKGANKEEREAFASAAVEETAPGLWERIEELIETVEAGKSRFKLADRESSNVQSALSEHKREAKFGEHIDLRAAA